MHWWLLALIIVACLGIGAVIGAAAMLIYVGRGMWG